MSGEAVLEKILLKIGDLENSKILDCFSFSKKHLSVVQRRDGISYFEHCVEVAKVLTEVSRDPSLVSVALLHDLLVDDEGEFLMNISPLNEREKELIRKMNQLRRLHINENTEDLDLVVDMFVEDPDLVLLRMAHRVNDVRNLVRFQDDILKKVADESLYMYSSIAERLGFHFWRREMENICFKFLHNKTYKSLKEVAKKHRDLDMF